MNAIFLSLRYLPNFHAQMEADGVVGVVGVVFGGYSTRVISILFVWDGTF